MNKNNIVQEKQSAVVFAALFLISSILFDIMGIWLVSFTASTFNPWQIIAMCTNIAFMIVLIGYIGIPILRSKYR